jgi:hypothetical protein
LTPIELKPFESRAMSVGWKVTFRPLRRNVLRLASMKAGLL